MKRVAELIFGTLGLIIIIPLNAVIAMVAGLLENFGLRHDHPKWEVDADEKLRSAGNKKRL